MAASRAASALRAAGPIFDRASTAASRTPASASPTAATNAGTAPGSTGPTLPSTSAACWRRFASGERIASSQWATGSPEKYFAVGNFSRLHPEANMRIRTAVRVIVTPFRCQFNAAMTSPPARVPSPQ